MRERPAHQLADGLHKGLQVRRGLAVHLLHELQRVEGVAVRGGAMVPARYEHPAAARQRARLLHRSVWRLRCAAPGLRASYCF